MAASDHVRLQFAGHFKNSHNKALLTVNVFKASGGTAGFNAYLYECHLVEDNDGAARAYGRNDPTAPNGLQHGLRPLDHLGNATSPHQNFGVNNNFSWVGVFSAQRAFARAHNLIIDDRNALLEALVPASGQPPVTKSSGGFFPVVQPAGAPAPGYYVSQTPFLMDPNLPDWNQRKYVDAEEVPYAVWASIWAGLGVNKNDVGLAIRNATGASSAFVFGDTGTVTHVGECSRKLVRTLSPTAYNEDLVSFIVFPGSSSGVYGPYFMNSRVRYEIAKLNSASNARIIGDHFSDRDSLNIMTALGTWGYQMSLKDI